MQKLLLFLIPMFIFGCGVEPTSPGLDPDRILHMAGEEAGQIVSPRERLTRQLNIANRETLRGKPDNARVTLGLARQTIEKADKKAFNDQARLSGWVSICELSRGAGDKVLANGALDQALAALNALTPDPARCEYVPGIENEVHILRGDGAAIALLRNAADWAMDLQPQETRRLAYITYAQLLFYCNAYEDARTVLRHDQDPAWRSDVLVAMADGLQSSGATAGMDFSSSLTAQIREPIQQRVAAPAARGLVEDNHAAGGNVISLISTTQPTPFFKSLDFKSNYYRP